VVCHKEKNQRKELRSHLFFLIDADKPFSAGSLCFYDSGTIQEKERALAPEMLRDRGLSRGESLSREAKVPSWQAWGYSDAAYKGLSCK
jgi:hypothetical protein